VFTPAEASQLAAARAADANARERRRSRPTNPLVYFDIAINGVQGVELRAYRPT
jgi:hypothetical protein